jgi:hypothetical protein
MALGLVSLCGLVAVLPSLRAEPPVLTFLTVGTDQHTPEDWPTRERPLLQPATSAPPEDPHVSACRSVGFQTEWVASKRDMGIPLEAVLAAAQRVFAHNQPEHDEDAARMETIATLVYLDPQWTPAELRDAVEAACLAWPWP